MKKTITGIIAPKNLVIAIFKNSLISSFFLISNILYPIHAIATAIPVVCLNKIEIPAIIPKKKLYLKLYSNVFSFIFFNSINNNINALIDANSKSRKSSMDGEKKENERYSVWFAESINILLKEKLQEFSNIQVILRGTKAEDKYFLSIVNKRMLKTISRPSVATALQWLAKSQNVKIKNEFLNVHEAVIANLFQQRNQYQLLNRLLRESIENESFSFYVNCIYEFQLWYGMVDKNEKRKEIIMNCGIMKKSGADLRKVIMQAKGTSSGDCLRGVEYQLLNALYIKNVDRFMDVVFRLYSSYGSRKNENGPELLIPTGIIEMLEDREKFTIYGYAFVAGLIGSYEGKKEEN